MSTFATPDFLALSPPQKAPVVPDPLVMVGVLKDATASSVQFSAGDFTDWLTLPTALIEEVTCLGMVEGVEANQEQPFPLFSITVKTPQTQSEHFFFDLVMPPFFTAIKNSNLSLNLVELV